MAKLAKFRNASGAGNITRTGKTGYQRGCSIVHGQRCNRSAKRRPRGFDEIGGIYSAIAYQFNSSQWTLVVLTAALHYGSP